MKTVLHFSTVHRPFDSRIFHKEIKALKDTYKVIFVCAQADKAYSEGNITIVPVKRRHGKMKRMVFSTFDVLKKVLSYKAEIYHFHDTELLPAGMFLKLTGRRVIFDSHENTYGMVLNRTWIGSMRKRKIIGFFIVLIERLISRNLSGVVVARPDLVPLYKNRNKCLFRNFPDVSAADSIKPALIEKTKPVVVYSGGMTYIRGIIEMIDAMDILGGKAELWLMGEWLEPNLEKDCKARPGYRYVKHLGVFPYGEHFSYIKAGDFGITPFLPAVNHLTTMPNKPFEYMMCRLPVLMSDFKYWMGMFHEFGIFFNPAEPESIAESIQYCLDNKEEVSEKAEISFEILKKKYSWNSERFVLLEFYNKLIGS